MTPVEWENLASLASLGAGVVAAGVCAVGAVPSRFFRGVRIGVEQFAAYPRLCGLCLFLGSLVVCGAAMAHRGKPQPLLHDEASYLLAADTFAHGRVTNPTPRFFEHFETPQQLMRPTYMSKYPPGQGIALAIGQLLTGQPIFGAWLSTALAVVAIYWMLLGFVSFPWALLGGILAVVHPKLLDWSQSYWGGSVAVIGSALFLGGWGRFYKSSSAGAGVVLACGLIVLANSRPFEGLVLCAPLILSLIYQQRGQIGRLLLPIGLPLILAGTVMGYYNHRVTGQAWRMPFVEYSRQYDIYPKFWMLSPRADAVTYRNAAMEFVHRYFERSGYLGFHTAVGVQENSAYRLNLLFTTNLTLAILLVPFLIGLLTVEKPWARSLKIAIGVSVIGLWTEIFVYPHYIAPLVPVVLLIVVVGMRKLARWRWGVLSMGRSLAGGVIIGALVGSGIANSQPMFVDRDLLSQQGIIDQFPELKQGRHLIFVAYGPMHSYHSELVHNLSDIDHQSIIWARRMDDGSDNQLARAYPDRRVWVLYIGGKNTLTAVNP